MKICNNKCLQEKASSQISNLSFHIKNFKNNWKNNKNKRERKQQENKQASMKI